MTGAIAKNVDRGWLGPLIQTSLIKLTLLHSTAVFKKSNVKADLNKTHA